MKTKIMLFAALAAIGLSLTGCTTNPGAVTPSQELWANATEDALSIGLVPVFAKNPDYIEAAQGISAALGSFEGTTLTPAGIAAFVTKTSLSPEDAKAVTAIVTAAWQTYERRYQAQAGAALRPDVRLFLGAVSRGIANAVAAVPKG